MKTKKEEFIKDHQIIENDDFQIYKREGLKWTDKMKNSVRRLTRLFDSEISFAVLGEDVFAPIFKEEENSFPVMSRMIRESCREIGKIQPDYVVDEINERLSLLSMNGTVFSVITEPGAELPEHLLHRQKILESCREEIIYGYVMGNGRSEEQKNCKGPAQTAE